MQPPMTAGAEGKNRSDREVDCARNQHQRHADREDRQCRQLVEERRKRGEREKAV